MNLIFAPVKNVVGFIANFIDNGKFFREPIVNLYRIMGIVTLIICFSIPILCGSAEIFKLAGEDFLNIAVFYILMYAIGIIGLFFWLNRANMLRSKIRSGSDIVVMPIIADFIQTCAEWTGLFIMLFVPVYAIFFGFIGQLFAHIIHSFSFKVYLGVLGGSILVSILVLVLGYFIIRDIQKIGN